MHKIGDNILYGASGVMTVVDIREESIGDVSRKYCVLRPALIRSDSLTFVPMDNEKLVSFMRPLLTKEEAIDFIHNASDVSPLEWIGENRARSDDKKFVWAFHRESSFDPKNCLLYRDRIDSLCRTPIVSSIL